MSKWTFLSYELSDKDFAYGNGERLRHTWLRNIEKGDTSNNSHISTPTHYGTHIDFPLHFSATGKDCSDYPAQEFIHEHIGFLDISNEKIEDYLIRNHHLDCRTLDTNITLLIIKTGFCEKRTSEDYWKYNWGFHHETAHHLKKHFPQLTSIAFDLISLSSYQQRIEGRIAHKSFLSDQEILIIEDVNLQPLSKENIIQQVVIAPLRIIKVEGTPVTIMALVK